METASVTLPKDLVEGAIEREVSAAMLKALGGTEQILNAAVVRVLNQKVDSEGKPSHYANGIEFVQWACGEAIRKATIQAFSEAVKNYEGEVKRQIVAALSKKNSPLVKQLVAAMTSGIVSAVDNKWKLTVAVM